MEIVIVANGDINCLRYIEGTISNKYIICADGAARYLRRIKVVPNLLVGDFDSIHPEDLGWMQQQGVECRKFPSRKDQTDTELAVAYAFELKPKSITIIGALGSRQDHSLANVMLLWKILQEGIEGKIIDEKNYITITNSKLDIEGKVGETISIIPLTNSVKGVTLKGLEYPLKDRDIALGSTLGISNVFAEKKAVISVKTGVLLVIKSRE
ncbi:thiamine diphosphokinase [Clostridium formicaceticum]|uniref:Thiamine diphosphokinase n=1 Tax=Clostridium formicaceticum TaxID=1497 RepID=A0AAC9RM78_9CLOT|nr:thiamine diphosphokinase [Clostridium formicaceticum]AOY77364.1 thiamine diphosphokinase [Clostridium formicaceticum]ARE87910.1 Thiamine pyrophosphokinase [Clostridium formicaceticum]